MMDLGIPYLLAFNLLLNSGLSFLTVFLLARLVERVLRLRHPRLLFYATLIPVFKLLVDLWLYDPTRWALAQHLNPVEAEPGTRSIAMSMGIYSHLPIPGRLSMGLFLSDQFTFSLADVIALQVPPCWVEALVWGVGLICACRISWFGYKAVQGRRGLRSLLSQATVYPGSISSESLQREIGSQRISVLLSEDTEVPFATGCVRKRIVLPQSSMTGWNEVEREAVIAHEVGHLKYYDPILLLFLNGLRAVFFWCPFFLLQQRAEEFCEWSCDSECRRHGIDPIHLAEALVKVGRKSLRTQGFAAISTFSSSGLRQRMQRLLKEDPAAGKVSYWGVTCFVVLATYLLTGRFWLF